MCIKVVQPLSQVTIKPGLCLGIFLLVNLIQGSILKQQENPHLGVIIFKKARKNPRLRVIIFKKARVNPRLRVDIHKKACENPRIGCNFSSMDILV